MMLWLRLLINLFYDIFEIKVDQAINIKKAVVTSVNQVATVFLLRLIIIVTSLYY